MRILLLSKALIHTAAQKKCEALAAHPGVELTVALPESWHEPRVGKQAAEARFTSGYQFVTLPIALNGQHHLHWYPTLKQLVSQVRPTIFHIDEESFNLATFQAMRLGVAIGARCCFYNYANIDRIYPPPFSWFERYNFRHAAHALAANREAETIIRHHGYQGPLSVIPQVGVDPDLFTPRPIDTKHGMQRPFTIGYIGRFVAEKGIFDLLEAFRSLPDTTQLLLIGEGDQRNAIAAWIEQLGLTNRITLKPWARDISTELHQLDTLVLPSHTTRTWKEQFGRILIEAMSCAIPVVGSSSGEIPHVIGDAGLIFQEQNPANLAAQLQKLVASPALCQDFGQSGRQRVLQRYTQTALAQQYLQIYQSMLSDRKS